MHNEHIAKGKGQLAGHTEDSSSSGSSSSGSSDGAKLLRAAVAAVETAPVEEGTDDEEKEERLRLRCKLLLLSGQSSGELLWACSAQVSPWKFLQLPHKGMAQTL